MKASDGATPRSILHAIPAGVQFAAKISNLKQKITSFEVACDVDYTANEQLAIMISAGWATYDGVEEYLHPFSPGNNWQWGDEKKAAVEVIIPSIMKGKSRETIRGLLVLGEWHVPNRPAESEGGMVASMSQGDGMATEAGETATEAASGDVTPNDNTGISGEGGAEEISSGKETDDDSTSDYEEEVGLAVIGDKETTEDGRKGEKLEGGKFVLDVNEKPKLPSNVRVLRNTDTVRMPTHPFPDDVCRERYRCDQDHVIIVLENFKEMSWPDQTEDIFEFVNWTKEHMPFTRDENPARFQMCCNFMNAVLKSDYKTLQSQHERYKSDYAAYEEATKHSSQEVVEISGSYSGEMLTKKQYRNRSQFDPTTIKLVNASATVAGSTEVSMFNKVSVNDFQRFGEKGMENSDSNLVNLATRLRTMWDYQPKDKTTDPDHERGLNYVCTGLRQLWVALSKRTTSNIHSLVEYNTKMPFGVDPVDEFCIGNYFHKLDWQPFGQEDCPRLVQNRPPSIGGPPIDYMLDWCWMTQCWDTRDMMKCPMHPYGCGKSLTREQTVIIWGEDCQRVRGNVLYTGVWMLDHNLTICCKVGVVKMVPYQTEYFHNRVGIVSEIYAPDDVSTEARDAVGKVIESRNSRLQTVY